MASDGEEEAENQPMSRMLFDNRGQLLYVGETATLSFLQLLRMMVETTRGPSTFTQEPLRHRIIENAFPLPSEIKCSHLLPEKTTCLVLVNSFFENAIGLIYVFDEQTFLEAIEGCYSDPLSADHRWLCLLNLVLAVGLILATPPVGSSDADIINQLRSKQPNRSDIFYYNAKSLNDPTIAVENLDFCSVQALLLITIYMLCRSRRNAAYTYLGMHFCHEREKKTTLTELQGWLCVMLTR